jgi:hypothetical protein
MKTAIQETELYKKFIKALDIHDMVADDNQFVVKCCEVAKEYASQSVNPMTEEEMGDWLDKIALTDSPNDLLETLWLFQQHLLSLPKEEKTDFVKLFKESRLNPENKKQPPEPTGESTSEIRYCHNCKCETPQYPVISDPDDENSFMLWECSVCKEHSDFV